MCGLAVACSLFNIFFCSALAFELNLWLGKSCLLLPHRPACLCLFFSHSVSLPLSPAGLFVFVGYVVYDTQVIVEQAGNGDKDIVTHALKYVTVHGVKVACC
jgi:hypothetical protein